MMNSKYMRNVLRIGFLTGIILLGYNVLQYYDVTKKLAIKRSHNRPARNISYNSEALAESNIQYIEFGKEFLKELNADKVNCEYPGIGRNMSSIKKYDKITCQIVRPSEEDCETARRSYGDMPKDRTCHEGKGKKFAEICRFSNSSFRLSSDMNLQLQCDPSVCKKNTVYVGGIHPSIGVLPDMDQWTPAKGKEELVATLNIMIKEMISKGIDFVFLGCKVDRKTIKQVLVLPPLLRLIDTQKNYRRPLVKPSINIIVLDSVSREHFFRRLPSTVNMLNQINSDTSLKSDVLDFELFQSLAPRTFPNIRALFSGEVDKDTDDTDHSYNIGSIFGEFVENGYQTMLQEDSCWFDSWGALITDNIHDLTPLTATHHFIQRWTSLNKKLRSMQVNNFGLTHFSCDVLLRYGVTNQFNDPPKVCYNGKLLTTYFLDYIKRHFLPFRRHDLLKPMFMYTHLNTGHEKTGKRIAQSDPELAQLIEHLAQQSDTVTILLSDHGPKTTEFAREHDRGRYELAHGFLFMIIPDKVRTALGDQYDALLLNQKRLATPKDLHFTLTGLLRGQAEGLLKPIDPNRGCKDLPLYSFTHCLCNGWNIRLPDSHRTVAWIAEFGLGFLNNLIQNLYTSSHNRITGGYGNCERLIGSRFVNIKTREDGATTIYNFDIVVYRYRGAEMFEFAISEEPPSQTKDGQLKVLQWRRVSIFQHFRKCLDTGVLPDLCICRPESSGKNPGRDLTQLLSSQFFRVRTTTFFLDSRCLALLTRTRSKSHRAYEVTNLCVDRSYTFHFDLVRNAFEPDILLISSTLPVNITVRPWTTHFLTSVSFRKFDDADISRAGKLEIVKFFML